MGENDLSYLTIILKRESHYKYVNLAIKRAKSKYIFEVTFYLSLIPIFINFKSVPKNCLPFGNLLQTIRQFYTKSELVFYLRI